jgi:polysaccharide pyruvyl transferase WcaK-like protein
MKNLKILHLASFSGNIGDNANHTGFYSWVNDLSSRPITWTEFEIREFYWNERIWDRNIVDYINGFDGLVIGGGNYFELWVDRSPTGTSIGLSLELWQEIKVPVFVNALGVDVGQGTNKSSIEKFGNFLDFLVARPNTIVSVRNDGAKGTLGQIFSNRYEKNILHVPDNAFFTDYTDEHPSARAMICDGESSIVAINLASDMPEIRYSNFDTVGQLTDFCSEFAGAIERISEQFPDTKFIFVPHIFKDVEIHSLVISKLNDRLRRTRVTQSIYGVGEKAAAFNFSIYARASLVLGMRFHANVVAIANGTRTIGLFNYPQIRLLYEELNDSGSIVDLTKPGFRTNLVQMVASSLRLDNVNIKHISNKRLDTVRVLKDNAEPSVRAWFNKI